MARKDNELKEEDVTSGMRNSGFLAVLRPPDRVAAWVLCLGVVLPVAYAHFGNPSFYSKYVAPVFGAGSDPLGEMYARLYQFVVVFVLFFGVPAFVWRAVLAFPFRDAGWRLGDWRFGWKSLLVAVFAAIPITYLAAGQADFQAEYPLSRQATQEGWRFAMYEGVLLLYYVGWEFLFRGFMLFGLRGRYGDFGAIAIQTFPSVLLHIGKPAGELWGSVVAGFLFGAWTLRTGSVCYVLVFHYVLGVLNDIFCAWRGGLLG